MTRRETRLKEIRRKFGSFPERSSRQFAVSVGMVAHIRDLGFGEQQTVDILRKSAEWGEHPQSVAERTLIESRTRPVAWIRKGKRR